jgi:hypothetical protein
MVRFEPPLFRRIRLDSPRVVEHFGILETESQPLRISSWAWR